MNQVEEDLRRMKITGWSVKIEDRQVWNRIVEQTKTHPGLYSQKKKKKKKKKKTKEGIWHAWGREGICTGCWWETVKKREHLEDISGEGRK